jgi:hypothetical protein
MGGNLRSGDVRSCGCLQREIIARRNRTHGHSVRGAETPTYRSWKAMHTRCTNPNPSTWAHYGGRGIEICERWRSFESFLEDMGERPEGTSIDRIDVDGNYEPGNCRWATPTEQRANRRDGK